MSGGGTLLSILLGHRVLQTEVLIPIPQLARGLVRVSDSLPDSLCSDDDVEASVEKISSFLEKARQYAAFADEVMIDKARTVNYNFSHVALPVIALWNSKRFYGSAFGRRSASYLRGLWRNLSARMGRDGTRDSIDIRKSELENGLEFLWIRVPSPSVPLDALCIGVVASAQKRLFRRKLDWLRYFTLELGVELDSARPRYCVCEWKSPHPRPTRANYGAIPKPDPQLFLDAIEDQLRGESGHAYQALNAAGQVAGRVAPDQSGRNLLTVDDNADVNSAAHSLALVFAGELKPEHRLLFCRWAGIPGNEWTASHQALCALAIMHYLCDAKAAGADVPEAVRNVAQFLERGGLPPLDRPLSAELKSLFGRMFAG